MARFEAKPVKVTQERNASAVKTVQVALKVKCVSSLGKEARMLHERASAFQTAVHAKVSNRGKLLGTTSKRKKLVLRHRLPNLV